MLKTGIMRVVFNIVRSHLRLSRSVFPYVTVHTREAVCHTGQTAVSLPESGFGHILLYASGSLTISALNPILSYIP